MAKGIVNKDNLRSEGIHVPGCREELLSKYRKRYGQDPDTTPANADEDSSLGHWPVFISKLERGEKVTVRGWQIPTRFRLLIPIDPVQLMSGRFEIDGDDILRPAATPRSKQPR